MMKHIGEYRTWNYALGKGITYGGNKGATLCDHLELKTGQTTR